MRWIILIALLGCGGQDPYLIVGLDYPRPLNSQECTFCNVVVHMSPEQYANTKVLWQYNACRFYDLNTSSRLIDCRELACGLVPPGLRQDACGWEPPK